MQRTVNEEKATAADPQLIIAYDADGMAFSHQVVRDWNNGSLSFNRVLVTHTQNLLRLKKPNKTPIFVSGSNRQDDKHDRSNAEHNKTPLFPEYLPLLIEKVSSGANVDPFWLQDIFGYGKIPFDHQKLILLLGLLFHYESESPGPFELHLYDDQYGKILKPLYHFLQQNLHLISKKFTIYFHHYSNYFDAINDSFPPLQGRGEYNNCYKQMVRELASAAKLSMKKDAIDGIPLIQNNSAIRKLVNKYYPRPFCDGYKRQSTGKKVLSIDVVNLDNDLAEIMRNVLVDNGFIVTQKKSVDKNFSKPQRIQNVYAVLCENVPLRNIHRSIEFFFQAGRINKEELTLFRRELVKFQLENLEKVAEWQAAVAAKALLSPEEKQAKQQLMSYRRKILDGEYKLGFLQGVTVRDNEGKEKIIPDEEFRQLERIDAALLDEKRNKPNYVATLRKLLISDLGEHKALIQEAKESKLSPQEDNYKKMCLAIREIILYTNWNVTTSGRVPSPSEYPDRPRTNVPENMFAMLGMISQAEKDNEWEAAYKAMGQCAEKTIIKKSERNCLGLFRDYLFSDGSVELFYAEFTRKYRALFSATIVKPAEFKAAQAV